VTRIGILYTAALRQRGGIGRYTRALVGALAEGEAIEGAGAPRGGPRSGGERAASGPRSGPSVRGAPAPEAPVGRSRPPVRRYTLVVSRDAPLDRLPSLPSCFRVRVLPLPERWLTALWHRLRLPLAVDRWAGPFDVFHAPDFVLPPLARAAGLVTVHDLSYLVYPEGAVPSLRKWLASAVPRSLARARHVLADSESTRRDLERLCGVAPAKVTVVGAGVEPRFRPIAAPDALDAVRRRYRLPATFVLGLGTLEPRKNFTGLIRAFERLAGARRDVELVIAGGRGWLDEPILDAAARSPAAGRIHLPGFVDDADLPALYSLARVFAFPSHYEGFGIPVLEAMACGTPVVAADNSSLPEVAGDAALLVPAADEVALAGALERLLADGDPRARCIRLGLERAARFTWEAAAERLLEVYARL